MMTTPPLAPQPRSRRHWLLGGLGCVAAAALTACGIPMPLPSARTEQRASTAYEQKAARHLYQRYAARIYRGQLPAMLYAVAVLEIHVSGNGQIRRLSWMRQPSHAPEVVREIERMVRAAAPFPPTGAGNLIYTDTWLWDRSGRFQLDTLTEGQLPGG
ncbi:hypothetical protein [Comamonas aquatica]|uniref:hypothetical protein n=1 Tax=Comamonas aquatica TaxID=225991 RepID=UPI00244D6ACE|nr:hypothetical protein [Comamonas aquatica]MDH1903901.1 hypothetical protein [Comamonas aquatica]